MDVTLRLSWILMLPIIVGCGGSQQTPQDDRAATDASQATSPDVDKGDSVPSSPVTGGAETGTETGDAAGTESPAPAPGPTTPSKAPGGEPGPKPAMALDPPVAQWEAWAGALAGDDLVARQTAAEELDRLAADGGVSFVDALRHESPEVRRCAAFSLIDRFDPSDAMMVEAFTATLSDPDGPVRRMALSVAKRFPKDALVAAAPQLAATLENQNETAANRAAVARLIATLEADARTVLPKLLNAMRDDADKSVRSACLMAVSRVAEPDDAVAAFRQTLTDDADASVRGLAAVRLGRLGPVADAATADLANALEDGDDNVARKAADALVAIGAASVSSTAAKLTSPHANVRRLAVFVLGKLGPTASSALDELKKRLQDDDEEVRKLAELAIRRIEAGR